MIIKLTEGVLSVLGDGVLTNTHEALGYIDVDASMIDMQSDGSYFKYYTLDTVSGRYVSDTDKIDLENYKAIVAHGESLVKGVVDDEIKKYNEANKIRLESINNCKLYENDLDHPHQPFCVAIIAYNSLVWREARRIQEQISTGAIPMPTDQGFIDMLPKFA